MSAFSKKTCPGLLIVALSIVAALFVVRTTRESSTFDFSPTISEKTHQKFATRFAQFEAKEKRVDQTVWAKEREAEECGRTFESLWDALNAATNKLELIAAFPVDEIIPGDWSRLKSLPHGIEVRESAGPAPAQSAGAWRDWVEGHERAGWQLVQTEFRQNQFDADAAGGPGRSRFYFRADLLNTANVERATIEGDLFVDWAVKRVGEQSPAVKRIDASGLVLKTRRGEPPFRLILNEQIAPPEKSYFIDPLILYDLDGDGLSEIILAAKNRVYHRREGGRYEAEPLCKYPPELITSAVIGDFDGDGAADFLCAGFKGLYLFKGSATGTFDEPGRLVWVANPHLKYAQVLTCGDIDGDGDLDVWLGQYKVPYRDGQMPTPYHNANDGYPGYLLLNDGRGNFTDGTAEAGLEKKRWRRVYSGSFADLDGDGKLDLVVVSDFAGVDLYRNDGQGRFSDVSGEWVAEPHAFGMAHALADFNGDGRLDLLMIGMNSPAADRLVHLGLSRPGFEKDDEERARMTYGNRLYLARPNGGYDPAPFNDSIARSGWSWGCGAFDFDDDGYADVYIANGHESGKSVRDYDPEFWTHDIYVGDSRESVVKYAYFGKQIGNTRGQGQSYGGYEKNRLYWNERGASFVEIGHLTGVAMEEPSRNVVADDLDGDGRVDLLVTTFEAWPEARQTLRIYQNTLDDRGNWIGFRFREESGKPSPVGARVTLRYDGRSAVREIVTGDSHRSQHANAVHFGLGKAERVNRVEVRWPNGRVVTLREPTLNRYHLIRVPAETSNPQ
ncbi:MAG TPA: CRTAC1 family protein [Candidatus Angelobacter sp.]|nr:CRTAC1 family protein [Candidatus Angelobacter sp.]